MNRFDDKVVLITGGTSGMGLATARRFIAEGAHVVVTGRDRQRVAAAVAFLASVEASYINAKDLIIDGGLVAATAA
jgi:NAD(P)-dependent dehydrogenase (short-subunit alcohol dehydrogenase family)